MKNASLNCEDFFLNTDGRFLVIDALYLQDIKKKLSVLNKTNFLDEVRTKVFPYTKAPFALFKPLIQEFSVSNIHKVKGGYLAEDNEAFFSCDSGLIIFIKEDILLQFLDEYDYDELVNNSLSGNINTEFWSKLISFFKYKDLALVLSPGIEAGIDFEGSGLYSVGPPPFTLVYNECAGR
jgi:hypothetical protein